MSRQILRVLAAAGLLSQLAYGGSVYLNGVNIDGVTGQKFDKCNVRIDDNGNVFIDAPGYTAKVVQGTPTPPPQTPAIQPTPAYPQPAPQYTPPNPAYAPPPQYPPGYAPQYAPQQPYVPPQAPTRITKRYFMAVEQTAPGMTEFDIDVYVNAKYLMTIKNDTDAEALDITRYLSPGKNTVTFEAKKLSQGPRKSYSKEHVFSIVIGEGNEGGGRVLIDNSLAKFSRTAADAESISQDFSITAR